MTGPTQLPAGGTTARDAAMAAATVANVIRESEPLVTQANLKIKRGQDAVLTLAGGTSLGNEAVGKLSAAMQHLSDAVGLVNAARRDMLTLQSRLTGL